ncbi:MAG: 2-oxoglutarate dehydrogenase complex dihydrolipoyllysine-residue succinyltransferase [Myxococcales bacterium]|nr:2-oxoglutarate dehydrogenase complex dihydrolipoyllysine-residue succinyltransferase [Myxococcales bacterium]
MPVEVRIPSPGESITEVTVGNWRVAEGQAVAVDAALVEIETDKANLDVPAPSAGVLVKRVLETGAVAKVGDVVALLEVGATATAAPEAKVAAPAPKAPAAGHVMPAAARAAAYAGIDPATVAGTGPAGRVLKEDVVKAAARPAAPAPTAAPAAPAPSAAPAAPVVAGPRAEEVVPMTRMRRTIAERLVSAQQNAALLTTFNEVDMSAVMAARKRYQDAFVARHGIKLGFMSFFVKAVVEGLRSVPVVNAEVRGDDVVYKHYYDIGVAVGGGRGLVVPVIRNAEALGLAEIEKAIADFGKRAQENKIALDELQGGTFTISNGGIYGSLLSTPIVNPPQSGILGMHAIQDRPIAENGQVVIRPMMYVALTYDHRIVDGREAVTFLKRVKECVEDPARILIEA